MTGITILVADDSLAQRKVVGHLLGGEGMFVLEAEDGNEAVQMYKEHSPDAVILDLIMPNCNGREALVKILSVNPDAYVIIASSLGGEEDVETCLRIGAKSYVQKPFDFEDLLTSLKSAVQPKDS